MRPIADDRADVVIAGREVLAEGFRRYERLRVLRGDANAPRPVDLLRSGPAAAVLPIDLSRGEVVLLRQFRLAAHLANGKGDLVEIVAGHVEANETPVETARRECVEEIGVAPDLLVELFTYLTVARASSTRRSRCFSASSMPSRVPERAGAAAEHEADRAVARVDRRRARGTRRRRRAQRPVDRRAAVARAQPRATERDPAYTFHHILMGALLLAVTGLDPKPWEERFRTLAPSARHPGVAGPRGGAGRDRLCLRLACAAGAIRALCRISR